MRSQSLILLILLGGALQLSSPQAAAGEEPASEVHLQRASPRFAAGKRVGEREKRMRGPWSTDPRHPVIPKRRRTRRAAPPKEPLTFLHYPLLWALTLYQKVISPADGATCRMYPTCSAYARDAIHAHGPILGFVMAAERVMRSHNEFEWYPLIEKFGRFYLYDPVSNNDFWFAQPPSPEKGEEPFRKDRERGAPGNLSGRAR
ncbi:MAG: membrane protein insertion efficiency factor YidD [Deltaproteobacteria bacterium]|nr:MAG: membrane protein insertion efficiency factor YidD [Deltaproteobacteria bacterium]